MLNELFYSLELRDRPFNLQGRGGVWCFDSFRNLFSDNTRVRIFILFAAQNKYSNSRVVRKQISVRNNFFSPEFNIRLYDKISGSGFFFCLHQNQNIFFSNIGNQNIVLEKDQTPWKLNGPSLTITFT
jgi:hypothetical protein